MRVIAVTVALVAGLLVASLVTSIAGADRAATALWQGGLVVLVVGAVLFALRFVPARPIGLDRMEGSAFDDPDSFWGRWHRFYTERG